MPIHYGDTARTVTIIDRVILRRGVGVICSFLCGLTVAFLISLVIMAAKKANETVDEAAEQTPSPPQTDPTPAPPEVSPEPQPEPALPLIDATVD